MKIPRHRSPSAELAQLRVSLAESQETLRAIRMGEVDTLMVAGKEGSRLFTLQGAEHPYRVLIESMNEGALTMTSGHVILYANQCFARMVQHPLEKVIGGCLQDFLSATDLALLRSLLKQARPAGAKTQLTLLGVNGASLPVQISIRPLARSGSNRATIGMVVTDLSESRRNEERLRSLTRRVVQAQETERGRVALELHDNITQLLCGILVRCQTLADKLPARDGPAKREAVKLRDMLGETAEEVERIARDLRPNILEHLGLVAVLRKTTEEFAERTGLALKLAFVKLAERLPADIELTLYRILQEALKNVEKHARARQVSVILSKPTGFVQLEIGDDGIGFEPKPLKAKAKGRTSLGLLSMSERAAYVGGTLQVQALLNQGTEIKIRIPLPPLN